MGRCVGVPVLPCPSLEWSCATESFAKQLSDAQSSHSAGVLVIDIPEIDESTNSFSDTVEYSLEYEDISE